MSTPANQLPLQTGAAIDQGTAAPGATDPLMQLTSSLQSDTDKSSQAILAGAKSIQQEEKQVAAEQPPERNMHGFLGAAPLLMAISAVAGSKMGLHAKVMLGAMNGIVSGSLKGNDQAYQDALQKWNFNRQKLFEIAQLQQQYYETLSKAYANNASGKLQAMKLAMQLADNERNFDLKKWTALNSAHLGEERLNEQAASLMERLRHDKSMESLGALNYNLKQMQVKQETQGFTPQAINLAAVEWLKTGRAPNWGWGQSATAARAAMYATAANLAEKMPGGLNGVLANQARYHALSGSLNEVQKRGALINTNEDSARRQAQIVLETSAATPRTDWTIINKAIIGGETQIVSDPNASKLLNAVNVFSAEYAKVMTGQTTGQAVTDAARREAQNITAAVMSGATLKSVLAQEMRSMQNRRQAFAQQEDILTRMLGKTNAVPNAPTATGPNGQKLILQNGQWVPMQ
jgi:hypothetical protein